MLIHHHWIVWLGMLVLGMVSISFDVNADSIPVCNTFQTICNMNADQSLMVTDNNNDDRFITVPIDGAYYLSFKVTYRHNSMCLTQADWYLCCLDARRHLQGLYRLVHVIWINAHLCRYQ